MGKKSRRKPPFGGGTEASSMNRAMANKKEGECDVDCPCPSCRKDGWVAGRGVTSEKRDKKDKTRVSKAQKRNQQTSGNFTTTEQQVFRAIQSLKSPQKAANVMKLGLYIQRRGDEWARMHSEICEHEQKEEWLCIEQKATAIIEEISRARQQAGVTVEWCFEARLISPCERLAYFNRAQARMHGLNNHQGAVDDLTQALSFYQKFWGIEYGEIDTDIVELLFSRSKCHLKLGNLDSAYEDLRACSAGVKIISDENWLGTSAMPAAIVKTTLMVMAKRKLVSGASRPLFTPSERESIERDLGLNAYDRGTYLCLACGKGPSDVSLKRCSRCMNAWFCGPSCQKRAWKDGHKDSCKKRHHHQQTIPDKDKAVIDADYEEFGGVSWTHNKRGQPRALLKDPNTGRYFDPLTDENMYFYPSEEFLIRLNRLSAAVDIAKAAS